MKKPLKIAVIAGEESGDLLAADALIALRNLTKREIALVGVGGAHLAALGLRSFFDREDIALMGLGAALKSLPRIIVHIYRLSRYLAKQKPDFMLIVDSPDFTHRVARRLRKLAPDIPIVQYVAPSVWAWRPQRAKAMRAFIDLLLVILPFEPKILAELGGPKAVYVGHRLLSDPSVEQAYAAQQARQKKRAQAKSGADKAEKQVLLLLPGSRRSEIAQLLPVFAETAARLKAANPHLEIILPTLPHLAARLKRASKNWGFPLRITATEAEKWAAFATADAALAASGTVSLELALCSVPAVLAYKADWFATKFILPKITVWSAALPNIITDEPIMPEYYNQFVRAPMLAHQIERLLQPGPARQAQLAGFARLRALMQTAKPAGQSAAEAIKAAGCC